MIFALQLLLSLSILIILHEGGHFIPAKLFKTRVEKFYLFFDPYFSVLKKKIGETEYGIGWLPLGGYVKISGMVDESMDKEQMAKPAEPWEFRSKPAWQRLIIMIGGVVVNVIVGIVIYSAILFSYGKEVVPSENATYGVHCNPLMYHYGFRDGDKILALDGVKPDNFQDINKRMILDDPKEVTIDRLGQQMVITLPEDFGLTVFPNPASTSISIQSKSSLNGAVIKIYTIDGKILMDSNIIQDGTAQINVGQINQGLYKILVKTADGMIYQKNISVYR